MRSVGAGPVEAGAMVLLDDGVEVSPAFYLLLKRFLLVTQAAESGAASPAEEAGATGGAPLASRAGLLGAKVTIVLPVPPVAASCSSRLAASCWVRRSTCKIQ